MQATNSISNNNGFFRCREATVRSALVKYPPISFLGLPQEVRDQIWNFISSDIKENPDSDWTARPKTGYDGLSLVCRQIWHEISKYWRRTIIPHNRLFGFLEQPYSLSGLLHFKSISMEIPFNTSPTFLSQVALMFRALKEYVEDLRLFFIGLDSRGIRNFVHGCANRALPRGAPPQMLQVDAQAFLTRLPLIEAIGNLQNLRSLVVWNLNIPLLQPHLIKHKPNLNKLCVVVDPRTSLNWPYNANNSSAFLIPTDDNFPPVKELQISANAALTSSQIASKVAPTLEHLTWIMPDVIRQTGNMNFQWYQDSGSVLQNLHHSAMNLHTLRICIEGAFHEGMAPHRAFVLDFQDHMPFLDSLKKLELHLCSASSWMGSEFLQALPPNLERLYISDGLIDVENFLIFLMGLYTGANDPLPGHLHWLHGRRRDATSLGFVGYEYQPYDCPLVSDLQKLAILKINGRLLDRENNKHLKFGDHAYIEPRYKLRHKPRDNESIDCEASAHDDIEKQARKLCKPTYGELQTNLALLSICTSLGQDPGFGTETEAEKVFYDEAVAEVACFQHRTYPIEVDVGYDSEEHWTCK